MEPSQKNPVVSFNTMYVSNQDVFYRQAKEKSNLTVLYFGEFPIKEAFEMLAQGFNSQRQGTLLDLCKEDGNNWNLWKQSQSTTTWKVKGVTLLSFANSKFPTKISQVCFNFNPEKTETKITANLVPIEGNFYDPIIVKDPHYLSKTKEQLAQDIAKIIENEKSEAEKEYEKGTNLSKVLTVIEIAMKCKTEEEFLSQKLPEGWSNSKIN